ncbi:MAG: L,D-transpeptidase family protein [Planctomycetota bacterium]|nr:L,D-transpeptidase family protein [Planctomycetota bacterium]
MIVVWQLVPWFGAGGSLEPAQRVGQIPLNTNSMANNQADDATPMASTSLIQDPTLDENPLLAQRDRNPSPQTSQDTGVYMGTGSIGNPTPEMISERRTSQAQPPAAVLPSISPSPTPEDRANTSPLGGGSPRTRQLLQNGWDHLGSNRLVEARKALSKALRSERLSIAEQDQVRQALQDINEHLVFSPMAQEGDRYAMSYTIKGGDLLSSIVSNFALQVDWRFVQRINNISDPGRIRAGQRLKLVTGPFHAIVHKRQFRLDLYLGEGDDRVFVRSFPVGLGQFDSTPVGLFRIRPKSKLINPQWPDPRTGRIYKADDPANPIGERWLGLQGMDDRNRDLMGYGIHGTIDPDSIGTQASLGCVRMHASDVEIIYETLVESVSTVEILAD